MTTTRYYKIVKDGRGSCGFLCPPGHWNHRYTLNEYNTARSRTVVGIGPIENALAEDSGAVDTIRDQVRRIIERSTLVCSELWMAEVYGYFRGMYVPESGERNASGLISVASLAREQALAEVGPSAWGAMTREERAATLATTADAIRASLPAERHAAVAMVREYFPEHRPSLDLIADPGKGYGSYPCGKCGKSVQYEARCDGLAVYGSNDTACSEGGLHRITEEG